MQAIRSSSTVFVKAPLHNAVAEILSILIAGCLRSSQAAKVFGIVDCLLQVHLVELFAGPLALDTFKEMLSNRYLIHFIVNSAALGALVKGYSPSADNIKIVGDYWLRAASRKLFHDRMESKSNISDDPSRLNVEGIMASIGAVYTPPCLEFLEQPAPNRDPTQGFGEPVRVRRLWEALFARMAVAHSHSSVHIRPDARRA